MAKWRSALLAALLAVAVARHVAPPPPSTPQASDDGWSTITLPDGALD
jgi:hypothetical protein